MAFKPFWRKSEEQKAMEAQADEFYQRAAEQFLGNKEQNTLVSSINRGFGPRPYSINKVPAPCPEARKDDPSSQGQSAGAPPTVSSAPVVKLKRPF